MSKTFRKEKTDKGRKPTADEILTEWYNGDWGK